MSAKRTLDSFFQPVASKKVKLATDAAPIPTAETTRTDHRSAIITPTNAYESLTSANDLLLPSTESPSTYPSYAASIPQLPAALADVLATSTPAHSGKPMTHAPDLDLLYFQPFLPRPAATALFTFLRASLPFYRVKYSIKRGSTETEINTPRYTTVFGLDANAKFSPGTSENPDVAGTSILDAKTGKPLPEATYTCRPQPIPECLDLLRRLVEAFTGSEYNFVLVNYYASGQDSISYHSDDEKFLGHEPAIASLSLGATRDFLMRHKPLARDARKDATAGISGNRGTVGGKKGAGKVDAENEELTEEDLAVREAHKNPLKLPMAGGDMVLMRGRSQSHWLHSVPKRAGKGGGEQGRINITFRKALVKGGTENYYQYNVGRGPPMRWDMKRKEMVELEPTRSIEKSEDKDGDKAWTRTATKYGIDFERKWHEK